MDIRIQPTEDPRWCSVELYLEGVKKSVSGLWIVDHQMRVGSVTLRMAGVAGVSTNDQHRKKGYSRRVITRSVEYMREDGYDVSMLFGIRNFYPKFGYAATPFDYRVELAAKSALQAEGVFQTRSLEDKDLAAIRVIYEMNNSMRSGSVTRTDEWEGFSRGSGFDVGTRPCVVVNHLDEVLGYFVWDDTEDRSMVSEAGASHPAVWHSMVHAFAQRAEKLQHEGIQLLIPPDHPLSLVCKRYGCRIQIACPSDGGGMMRIVNLGSTFRKLLPELSRRWLHSDLGWHGCLRLCTDIGEVCLKLSRTGVELGESEHEIRSLTIPQTKLTQLLIGYRTAAEVQSDEGVEIPTSALSWLNALFPASYPYIWWSDRF